MLAVYADFAENWMGIPVIRGRKTESERFPGAVDTLCVEAMMQDCKALQAGTSHHLGQNFSKAAGIKFQTEDGVEELAWTTSWGMTTRMIGALVMVHSDDDGLRLPPRMAPAQVVILPVLHKEETRGQVLEYCEKLRADLQAQTFGGEPVRVEFDTRDARGGEKTWNWVKKGVPVRVEVGPRDIASDSVFVARRDKGPKEKYGQPRAEFVAGIGSLLEEIQSGLLETARSFREENTVRIDTKDDLYAFFTPKDANKPEIHGGFALAHWSGDPAVEEQVSKDLNVTIRCIPLDAPEEEGKCVLTGGPSRRRVIFAKAY